MNICQQAAALHGCSGIADRIRIAAELLVAGVAFQTSGTRWRVVSHDGDEIGELSTFMLSEVSRLLKRVGLRSTVVIDARTSGETSITFGYSCFEHPSYDEIFKRRCRNYATVH